MRGSNGGDIHVFHEFDVALCDVTVENAALSLSLVGHPCIGDSFHQGRSHRFPTQAMSAHI